MCPIRDPDPFNLIPGKAHVPWSEAEQQTIDPEILAGLIEGVDPSWGKHFLPRELAKICYEAGWTNAQKLLEAVSVIIAESNGYEHRKNTNNPDGSIDRGIWMLNNKAYANIPDNVCFDSVAATKEARKIYVARNYSFRAWSAYTNGRYKDPKAMGYAFDGVANFLRLKNGFKV